MEKNLTEFEKILVKENDVLDSLVEKHSQMKKAVMDKNWESLTDVVSKINVLYENFQDIDTEREVLQDMMKTSELKPYLEKIGLLRSKLLKCKIENQALNKYVNITREFLQGVIENAIPQSGSKVYSKEGKIIQPQPQSVVLNMSF
jgi:hypothetical protein